MTITKYDPSMKNAFCQLLCDYFHEIGTDIPEEILKGKLIDLIEREAAEGIIQITVAMESGILQGFSIYQVDDPRSDWCKRPGWGFIREFYVTPDSRNRGLGRSLAQYSQNQLRQLNVKQIYLTADHAASFWENCGWTESGETCSNELRIFEKRI